MAYKDDYKVKPLCIMLSQMGACTRNFDTSKCISF